MPEVEMQKWKKLCPKTLLFVCGLMLTGALYISLLNGSWKEHCDLKLASGDILRVVHHGTVTRGEFVGIWIDHPATLLRLRQGQLFPEILEERMVATTPCEATFEQQGNRLLIGGHLYSSDSGETFSNLGTTVFHIPERNSRYICWLINLTEANSITVEIWEDCSQQTRKPPEQVFVSFDDGKTWKSK